MNAAAAHNENELPDTKELWREGAASQSLPTISFGGVLLSEPYEEGDVVGQSKCLVSIPVTLPGQVSP